MSEQLKLFTGKIIDATEGIIGLGIGPKFELGSGADDTLYEFEENEYEGYPESDNIAYLTRQERLELCEIMIARWQAYKTKVEAEQ